MALPDIEIVPCADILSCKAKLNCLSVLRSTADHGLQETGDFYLEGRFFCGIPIGQKRDIK